MRKILMLILFVGITTSLFSQNRKGTFSLLESCDQHELYVSFFTDDFLYSDVKSESKIKIEQLSKTYSLHLERNTLLSEKKISELYQNSNNRKGNESALLKLQRIYKVIVLNHSNEMLYELAGQFEELEEVEYASLVPLFPINPPSDEPSDTPDLEYLQTYFGPNPGVDMHYAWSLGLFGENIRIRDIEYGFNANHEVLIGRNIAIADGMDISPNAYLDYTEHGTAVFGIVYAHNENYGNKGMAYGAQEMILFPEWQSSGYNRINAISKAIENSTEGDVIIFEMQYPAYPNTPNDYYVPAEFHPIVWDLTNAATESGIIVVAAAGNGAQNIDSQYFTEYNNRGNSGAIIVGAGSPTTLHSPLYFTTYGSRVDVQAWGQNVFTCGYGNYLTFDEDFNRGYTMFSGTSSATPIVASCVIVLQSYWNSLTNEYLSSLDMRDLLVETGNPQMQQIDKHIGPIPNMQNAIEAINVMVDCEMPINAQIETDDDCMIHIYWEIPQDIINPRFNIYRNNELVAENLEETFYNEYIDPEVKYEWSIRTVCYNGMSKKVRLQNEMCDCECLPAIDFNIDIDSYCLLKISWDNPDINEATSFNVYKDKVLVAEKIAEKSYSESVESDKEYEWCIEVLCDEVKSPKRCKTIICQGGNIENPVLQKLYRFYPNPVKNELRIERTDLIYEKTKIEVNNVYGTTILTTEIEDNQLIINFDSFQKGIYLLKIHDTDKVFVKKIVKQ